MGFVSASPNEYLVTGQGGKIVNRGSGIQVYLWPGSTYVLIPSTKQEALFEMTQETKDGIPLHFKGIVIYRISDPVSAAMSFDFNDDEGVTTINSMLRDICLGELRATVSGMTMNECIEQRKTVLTAAVDNALKSSVFNQESTGGSRWGIELELAQVAQVYIMDSGLRKQLEAEVRNEIRSKSDQSDIHLQEQIKLTQLASDRQVQEQRQQTEKDAIRQKEEIQLAQLASNRQIQEQRQQAEKDAIRQREEIELANLQVKRRLQKQNQEAENEAVLLGVEAFKLNEQAAREKVEAETPVRLLQIEKQKEISERELELRKVEMLVRELEVSRDMLLEKARQELRKEILPVEQIPEIADSLSNVFRDANLNVWGSDNQLFASVLPLMSAVSEMLKNGIPNPAKTKPD